jgi:hypothetical protein
MSTQLSLEPQKRENYHNYRVMVSLGLRLGLGLGLWLRVVLLL